MTDTDTEFDFEEDTPEETPKRRGRKPGKRIKHPIPAGWETPSDIAIRLQFNKTLGNDENGDPIVLDSTTVYSIANAEKSDFPSTKHTDGRLICDIKKSMKWFKDRQQEFQERNKLRAERAANREQSRYRSLTKTVHYFASKTR